MVKASALQAEDTGSIPATRSTNRQSVSDKK